jgi:hypothetical protein
LRIYISIYYCYLLIINNAANIVINIFYHFINIQNKLLFYYIYMNNSKNIKYIVIIGFIVFLLYIINSGFKEGFNPNALLTYDSNSPKNSHNVDVVNNSYSCSNFCGPKATCIKTGEQCTSDVDCYGCQPPINNVPPEYLTTTEVKPLDDAGKLTSSQTPQYSTLTTDIGSRASSSKPGSLNKEIIRPYEGYDKWTKSFNYGLDLAEKKLIYQYSPAPEEYRSMPVYPVTISTTGLFYDMGPTAANASM